MSRIVRGIGRSFTGRVFGIALAVVGAGALAQSAVRAGEQPARGCPSGFDFGPLTFPQSLTLPRIQAGLADGIYTMADLASAFNHIDHNRDGLACFKDVGALSGNVGGWQYLYNGVDNAAADR